MIGGLPAFKPEANRPIRRKRTNREKINTRQQTTRIRRAGAWAAIGSVLAAGTLFTSGVSAQEVLPKPEPPFKGKIGRTYKESQPDKIPITRAPEGAPNVLVILIDDCGYGQWGTFGGQVPTPGLDRLAKTPGHPSVPPTRHQIASPARSRK
jgi:hypothetical protein